MKTETTIVTIFILVILWAVITLLKPVYGYEPYEVGVPTDQRPEIAQCDKELWLRIKDGCDD